MTLLVPAPQHRLFMPHADTYLNATLIGLVTLLGSTRQQRLCMAHAEV